MCIVSSHLQVGEGITSLHHLQHSIPVPTFSSAVRCFEFHVGGMFLLHARNPGYFLFLFSGAIEAAVSCLYTAQIKIHYVAKSMWTHARQTSHSKSWALIWSWSPLGCYNSLQSSGKAFHEMLEHCCGDLLSFSHKIMSVVRH